VTSNYTNIVLVLFLPVIFAACDPDVYSSYIIENQMNSDFIVKYSTFYDSDSMQLLASQSNIRLYDESYWGTDVYDVGDSISRVINFIELYDMDSNLVYEQNPTDRSKWDYDEKQNAFFFVVNMGGTSKYTFVIQESIF
jgi:hypothetical protein